MKTPWINTQPARLKEMTILKFSLSKRPDTSNALNLNHIKDYEKETGSDNSELDTTLTNITEPEANNRLTPAEFVNEVKELAHAEMTDDVQMYEQGKVCYLTKNSPFSVHVEIDDFLHDPICGDITRNTFEFHDRNNTKAPEFDTKLFHTTTYYPEQPECRLICSHIHEIVFLSDDQNEGKNNKGNHYKSVVRTIHDTLFTETEESDNHSYVNIRVPVVLGEYNIEICLEENLTFKDKVMRIKEISKELVLNNFKLVPTVFSQALNNGTRTVLKGNLFIEGDIRQTIEYTALPSTDSITSLNQLNQKMIVELIIHILQVQNVLVKR
jgi:hypothetical protein